MAATRHPRGARLGDLSSATTWSGDCTRTWCPQLPQARRNQQWIVLCAEGYTSSRGRGRTQLARLCGHRCRRRVRSMARCRTAYRCRRDGRRSAGQLISSIAARATSKTKLRTSSRCGAATDSCGPFRSTGAGLAARRRTPARPRSAAWPDSAASSARNASSSPLSMPHSVWCRSTISRVPSSRWLMANERSTSGVITPPAFLEQVRVADVESECPEQIQPRIHARDDSEPQLRPQRTSPRESGRVALIGVDEVIDGRHVMQSCRGNAAKGDLRSELI